jgi:predicted phosphodiesterase
MSRNHILHNLRKRFIAFFAFTSAILSLLIFPKAVVSQDTFVKSPYIIFNNNVHGMRLLWQNDDNSTCDVVLINTVSGSSVTYRSNEINEFHQHILNIDSLQSGDLYSYKISCNGKTENGSFRARPYSNLSSFSFFAYGDTRTFPENHNLVAAEMAKLIKANNSNQTFVVATGDMVANGDKEEDWAEQFFNKQYSCIQELLANMPYMSAMGNHEGQGDLFERYFPYDYNTANKFYYSFDYGIVHFIVIDQFANYSKGSEQYKWIVSDLESNKSKWVIAMMHKPGYTAGGHRNSKAVQRVLQPLFKDYNIKLVLTGHNHYYARAEVDGVTHITTGGGGAPLYYPKKKKFITTIDRSFHFCKIDVSNDSLIVSAIRSDGTLIEKFTIKR